MKKRSTTDILDRPAKAKREIAYEFVLDALDEVSPTTRPLFGSNAVYVGERVFFILRKKGDADDGVWVAFEEDREADAMAALPNLERIARLPNVRSWRKLAANSTTFEEDVLTACRLAASGGPLGKIPMRQKAKARAGNAVTAKATVKATKAKATKAKATKAKATKAKTTKAKTTKKSIAKKKVGKTTRRR